MKARVAQLAEHRPCKSVVIGSTPVAGSGLNQALRAPGSSPAAAGIFYLTGQHVRIVTTARNCSARSYGDSRMTLRYHTNAELERMRDSNWRDQQSLLQRPKSGAVTRTIKALQVRMVEIIDEINKRISIVDDQPF